MKTESFSQPSEAEETQANLPHYLNIGNLPQGLGFPAESHKLSTVEEELFQEADKCSPRDTKRLKELSNSYEQAAADLMEGWQISRMKTAVVGAFIAKANLFGRYGYVDYQKDALVKAGAFAVERKFNRVLEVIDDALDKLEASDETR